MQLFLGKEQIGLAALGNKPVESILQAALIQTIPTANLVFWLSATNFTTGSSTWASNFGLPFSGSFVGPTPVQKRSDNGGVVNFTTSSVMNIGPSSSLNYQAQNYTLFVATRYSGSATDRHGRLLSSQNTNWLAPTYGGGGGGGDGELHSAYYNGSTFIILSGSIYDTEWRISTVVRDIPNLSSSFYVNGVLAASGSNNGTTNGFGGLSINDGLFQNGTENPGIEEVTQADVGDILLYNTVLNQSQINVVYNSLKLRYGL